MEDFRVESPRTSELRMSVSPVCQGKDGEQYAYVSFQDGARSAEGRIPDCSIVRNSGFTEEELVQLRLYMTQELKQLKKMAASVDVFSAFMQ